MQQTKILKFFTLLISTSFLCSPSFGEGPLCKQEPQATQDRSKEQKDQPPVTLQETLERTYMQNAILDAARAGLRSTVEDLSQANADWRPSLSVQGTQNFTQTYNTSPTFRAHTNSTGYVARIDQNIYNGGATVANIETAESNVFAGKAGLFSQEQATLFDAVSAHASVIATQDIVKYLQDSVSFYKTFYERVKAQHEVGEKGRTDVEAALAEYEGAKGKLSQAIGDLETAKAQYFQIVASSPENLAPPNVLLDLPKTYEDVLTVAQTNNPQITEARFALEAAQYTVDSRIAGLLPKLGVQGTVGSNRNGGTTQNGVRRDNHPKQTELTAAAILDVPLYKQGVPNSQVRQAYQLVAQQKVRLVQTLREVEQAAKTAWEQHIAAREALKGFMAEVKAGELAVEGGQAEEEVGETSVVDVLVLQNQLIDAQIRLVNAQKDLITKTYSVLQSMGSLMASNLKLNVQYYDPDCYYNEYKDAWIQFWQGEDWRYVRDEPCGPICKNGA